VPELLVELGEELMGEGEPEFPLARFREDRIKDVCAEVLGFVDDKPVGVGVPDGVRGLAEGIDDEGAHDGGGLVPEVGEVSDVFDGDGDLGRIFQQADGQWFWGVSFQLTGRKSLRPPPTLDEAKAAFRAEYEKWKGCAN
jgi:hypothetical protein